MNVKNTFASGGEGGFFEKLPPSTPQKTFNKQTFVPFAKRSRIGPNVGLIKSFCPTFFKKLAAGGIFFFFFFCCLTVSAKTIDSIPLPGGYTRLDYPAGSFSDWVQALPLKNNKEILRHDGGTVGFDFYDTIAVVDMPLLFSGDLEQCADYCMRFWAEYHKAKNLLPNLYLFDYNGSRKPFSASNKSFKNFLKWAFAFSNSHSLKKGCKTIKEAELRPGDMIVQNERGGIGHVSMIMDICETKTGQRLYLIGYSFMPAQEFHIEKAAEKYGSSGWFTLAGYVSYLSDFLDLGKPVLRRFSGPIDECLDFSEAVRDQTIAKEKARAMLPGLYKKIKVYAAQFPFKKINKPAQPTEKKEPWVFPVQGYSIKDAGKGGFKPGIYYGSSPIKGYNFFDGNKHGGHPAYDIFIRDKDRDCLDDNTKKPVNLLAPVDLLVLVTYTGWKKDSHLRGGNYVWALDPRTDLLYYFAHLDKMFVRGGDFCKAGAKLGTLGRSGKNAFPARSPTHLHLMVLYIKKQKLIPYDFWKHIASGGPAGGQTFNYLKARSAHPLLPAAKRLIGSPR
ncbi:MAG: hypothetical protein KAW12_27940, partial [Candidatus Aminicenantes bacterium]|nr:hypothetical protein [Candidatus Aminicenantes bacterium]